MIKKLLATTLATLSVASMSLPAMATDDKKAPAQQTEQSAQQTTSHKKRVSHRKGKNKNKNKSEKETLDFEIIEKDPITKYDTGELPLYEEKEVKANNANKNFTFVDISANKEQRKALDKESARIKCLQDGDKSAGYLAIENNMISLRNNVINTQDALKKFDVSAASSEAWNAAKDAAYIAGDVICYPISGGLRYAYNHGLLTKAKDKAVKYAENDLKNKALSYVGLNKKDNKKDGKIATAFKWGKSVFNFFTK